MITGLSHVSIVVPNLDAAARELEKKYGLRMAYVDLGNAKIELMEPSRPDSPVAKFLARNPHGGIHHFSLQVQSLQATKVELEHKGARVLGDGMQKNVHGERIAFVHPQDFFGALVELEEHLKL
jgi:methylmalonyl-CoA/ethylmalonyl-CoA epimerase